MSAGEAKDPEVAAALEDELLRRGVQLYKGARAEGVDVTEGGVAVRCNDGRVAAGSHALLAIGSIPNSDGLGLDAPGVEVDDSGYVPVNHHCVTNVGHIYAADAPSWDVRCDGLPAFPAADEGALTSLGA